MNRVVVIIPNHGHDEYLPTALQSITGQTYPCDVIVAEDPEGIGKGARLNQIVPTVQHEWLSVMDADDVSVGRRFRMCSEYFDHTDVIYHDFFTDGELDYEYKTVRAGQWCKDVYRNKNYIAASCVMVRTEIAQKARWRQSTYGQDWLWLNEIAQHTDRFLYIPEALVYRNSTTGFTSNLKFKSVRRFIMRRKIAWHCRG